LRRRRLLRHRSLSALNRADIDGCHRCGSPRRCFWLNNLRRFHRMPHAFCGAGLLPCRLASARRCGTGCAARNRVGVRGQGGSPAPQWRSEKVCGIGRRCRYRRLRLRVSRHKRTGGEIAGIARYLFRGLLWHDRSHPAREFLNQRVKYGCRPNLRGRRRRRYRRRANHRQRRNCGRSNHVRMKAGRPPIARLALSISYPPTYRQIYADPHTIDKILAPPHSWLIVLIGHSRLILSALSIFPASCDFRPADCTSHRRNYGQHFNLSRQRHARPHGIPRTARQ
jgi:hypothetical protein